MLFLAICCLSANAFLTFCWAFTSSALALSTLSFARCSSSWATLFFGSPAAGHLWHSGPGVMPQAFRHCLSEEW